MHIQLTEESFSEDLISKIANKVAEQINYHGKDALRQSELCERAGISYPTLIKYEREGYIKRLPTSTPKVPLYSWSEFEAWRSGK